MEFQYGHQNVTVLGNNHIRVKYPKGSVNPAQKPQGGFGATSPFHSAPKVVHFSYQVKFDANFSFQKGGKLPGLYFKEPVSGGEKVSEGGSIRYMWRKNGRGDCYLYYPAKKQKFGESNFTVNGFKKGEWHTIKMAYNTEKKELLTCIDEKNPMILKRDFKSDCSGIFYSTFFGGHTKSWAAVKDEFIEFKNFQLVLDGIDIPCFSLDDFVIV